MKIVVVGLGKIGLPLAVQYAFAGQDVTGVDVNESVVEQVNNGVEPFPGETDLQARLSGAIADGRLSATSDYASAVPTADVIVVVVPLYVDEATGEPDFGWMDSATNSIGASLTEDTLVIYETTLPVGTTRSRWIPALEKLSGLAEGEGFRVVFSPERVLTGRVFEDLRRYPKLIGATTKAGAEAATKFYDTVLEFDVRSDLDRPNGVWDLGSLEAAELAKLAETTYRDVNIGLANQFALFAGQNGIDIAQVIAASNSQPYSHIHKPGIAVGGHCIPVYPRLYLWGDRSATVVNAAREANLAMPALAVEMTAKAAGGLSGSTVVVLGAAYRGGVKETAFSGVFPVVAALEEAGAQVVVHDPMFSDDELRALGLEPWDGSTRVRAAIIQADHEEYGTWGPEELPGVEVLFDGRRLSGPGRWPGVEYLAF